MMRWDWQYPDFGFGIWYTGADGMVFKRPQITCMIAWFVLEWELPVMRRG